MFEQTLPIFTVGLMLYLCATLIDARSARHALSAAGAGIFAICLLSENSYAAFAFAFILFVQHLNLAFCSVNLLDPLDRLVRRRRPKGANSSNAPVMSCDGCRIQQNRFNNF